MTRSPYTRQRGVVSIEFALGFITLFMFTMLLFEVARLTYICSVLDYATAEAARDARVQLQKNKQLNAYQGKDCQRAYKGNEEAIHECQRVQSMQGNELAIWYYAFLKDNATTLMKVFSSQGDFQLQVTPYKDPQAYVAGQIYRGSNMWDHATLAEYQVIYTYRPLMLPSTLGAMPITRRLLVVQDTALFRANLKGGQA
ncbi:TadE/TadG family type IV pilus assembly protein [Vibrio navarrensis]